MRPRICGTIVDSDLFRIGEAEECVDLYEVRIDLIGKGWRDVVAQLRKPWIACDPSVGSRKNLYDAIRAGASIVDVQSKWGNIAKLRSTVKKSSQYLLSWHNPVTTPSLKTLNNVVSDMLRKEADICKVVTHAQSWEDCAVIFNLQSPSPAIMNAAFRYIGRDAIYVPIRAREADLDTMNLYGVSGFNVTRPLKVKVAQLVDKLVGPAAVIKCVNTVMHEGNQLIGYNTDVSALMDIEISPGRTALVVGAGGAARAACFMLNKREVQIYLANRSADRIKKVTGLFKNIIVCDPDMITPDILVNATPLPIEEIVNRSCMPREMIIDYPYHSSDKRFLIEAADAGIRVIDGFDLLISQALDAFILWTGVNLTTEEVDLLLEVMKEAIEH